jgi:Cu/Ag efflux protein CusF
MTHLSYSRRALPSHRCAVAIAAVGLLAFASACGSESASTPESASPPGSPPSTPASPTAASTHQSHGDSLPTQARQTFQGTGTVTKIDAINPSIELDHDPIAGHMPAMRMEWFLSDAELLDSISVGDRVAFTLELNGARESIIALEIER